MVNASLAEYSDYPEAIVRVEKQYISLKNILEVVRKFCGLAMGCHSSRELLSVPAYTLPPYVPVYGLYPVYNILLHV